MLDAALNSMAVAISPDPQYRQATSQLFLQCRLQSWRLRQADYIQLQAPSLGRAGQAPLPAGVAGFPAFLPQQEFWRLDMRLAVIWRLAQGAAEVLD